MNGMQKKTSKGRKQIWRADWQHIMVLSCANSLCLSLCGYVHRQISGYSVRQGICAYDGYSVIETCGASECQNISRMLFPVLCMKLAYRGGPRSYVVH